MIKKLSKKLVLVFSMLAVVLFTVSSCYASTPNLILGSYETPFSKEELLAYISSKDSSIDISNVDNYKIISYYYPQYNRFIIYFCYNSSGTLGNAEKINLKYTSSAYDNQFCILNDSNSNISFIGYTIAYHLSNNSFDYLGSAASSSYIGSIKSSDGEITIANITDLPVYYNNTCYYDPVSADFDYTLTGIKRGAVRLDVTGLDSSLRMYGYVGVKNNYEIGDTFDGSTVSEYLRLLTIYSDNTDLNCTLYRGEELVYYILDSNNVILDIGYISEMAKDYFLYGFNVDNGVDFEFINDGQVYWSDSLTFKYSLNNSAQLTNNSIVSSVDNYIKISNTVTNVTCDAIVYLNGNEISTASVVKKNNLSSLSITVHSSYSEVDTLFNKNTSIYNISNVFLEGTDEDGNSLDFSRYRVRWSIPTWLELKQITLAGNNYSKYNGTSSYFSSVGSLSLDLRIYEIVDSHKAPFDITLEILNGNNDVVLTKVINSDTIVKEEVDRNENNVDKDDFEIIDSPNYTGGGNNYPGSDNIHNWSVNDFANYLGTNNTIFNFFWAFLNNMPTWISTPLSILLIGIVVITLYKAFRG